jgi:hypothetical protein
MPDLKVQINESITLPNRNTMTTHNTTTITNVNQIVRNVDTVTNRFENQGIEILRLVDNAASQTAGSFVRTDVKYIRITNLSTEFKVSIYLVKQDTESAIFFLDPTKSLMFSNGQFNASNVFDYVQDGFVDPQYYSNFTTFDIIKAKTYDDNQFLYDAQLEYVVASS